MKKNKNKEAFIALVRSGLWADTTAIDSWFMVHGSIQVDWEEVYQLAEEQSIIGVVLAGIEHINVKPPQELLLQWIGEVQMQEQQNKSMNLFIAGLVVWLRKADIYALLVKGQGIAQCYEKPLWRTSGDIDILLDGENYEKAKALLIPLADEVQGEDVGKKHQAIIIKGFDVELHGKMHFGLSRKADKELEAVIEDALKRGGARIWTYNNSDVYLPNADNDVILVFTHFLRHFFIEGVGLRQICDWCRLLWAYKDSLNHGLLEKRIRRMELMSEWKALASLAVDLLGMPVEAMPMYDSRFTVKGEQVLERILKSGNMGHNNDLSYRTKYSGITYKLVALWRRVKDFASFTLIFPVDAPKFFITYIWGKVK